MEIRIDVPDELAATRLVIVCANTSPLLVLARLDRLDLLANPAGRQRGGNV